ncbi:unnamed protein product [Rotaria sp. Silwood2]|nr:unnamed protein product [Rotaria sp. Silwood2]CAF3522644.1 unnamed protein product [Rotaria sp. Silwood2]
MDLVSLSTEEVRNLFKHQRVILIGDSIVRGIYKDLCCVLTGNNRLLYSNELQFNRHQIKKETLFGEAIEKFYANRRNSAFNVEQRSLKSKSFGYDVTYIFTSRIWNQKMVQLLSSLDKYDIIIVNSQIWDLSRYEDNDGQSYLKNLDIFFSKVKLVKKNNYMVDECTNK